jgi:hypothetical protein
MRHQNLAAGGLWKQELPVGRVDGKQVEGRLTSHYVPFGPSESEPGRCRGHYALMLW